MMELLDCTILYRTAGTFHPLYHLFFSPGVAKNQPPQLIPSLPTTTIEEIESYYCPQCLENFPSSEAMQFRGRCPRSECFTCAECGSVAPPVIDSASSITKVSSSSSSAAADTTSSTALYYFRCNFCRWNSVSSGLTSDSDTNLVSMALNQEQGPEVDHVRMRSRCLQTALHHREKQTELHKRLSGRATASVRSAILLSLAKLEYGQAATNTGKWGVKDIESVLGHRAIQQQQLYASTQINAATKEQHQQQKEEKEKEGSGEKKEEKKQEEEKDAIDYNQQTCVQLRANLKDRGLDTKGRKAVIVARLEEDDASRKNEGGGNKDTPPRGTATRSPTPTTTPTTTSTAAVVTAPASLPSLPLRCKLRTKRSLRCRETFNRGHPGILLKSHINPLTGDSSMRAHMGKWYKKSSFGRNSIPRLAIRKCTSNNSSSSSSSSSSAKDVQDSSASSMNDSSTMVTHMSVEMTITNPTDIDLYVTLSALSKEYIGSDVAQVSSLFVETSPALMTEKFYIKQYDELEEQDWSDEQDERSAGGGKKEDPPSIIDRIRNKVVVTIPLMAVDVVALQKATSVIFPLKVHIEEKRKGQENKQDDGNENEGLNFSYEVQVVLEKKLG